MEKEGRQFPHYSLHCVSRIFQKGAQASGSQTRRHREWRRLDTLVTLSGLAASEAE